MLTQPAVAEATQYNREATRYNKEMPLQGVARGNRTETTAEGQSLQQKGKPHTSRADPRQAKSD